MKIKSKGRLSANEERRQLSARRQYLYLFFFLIKSITSNFFSLESNCIKLVAFEIRARRNFFCLLFCPFCSIFFFAPFWSKIKVRGICMRIIRRDFLKDSILFLFVDQIQETIQSYHSLKCSLFPSSLVPKILNNFLKHFSYF